MADEIFSRCAEAIEWANGLLVTASAGMGVDFRAAGLPGAGRFLARLSGSGQGWHRLPRHSESRDFSP